MIVDFFSTETLPGTLNQVGIEPGNQDGLPHAGIGACDANGDMSLASSTWRDEVI